MQTYKGSCHCGSIAYTFKAPVIDKGLRCNCSICIRKGAMMSAFTLAPEEIEITIKEDSLSTYQFDSKVAKHHFCNKCGIYTFHETVRFPGQYRVNLGCLEGVNSLELPSDLFDGASL